MRDETATSAGGRSTGDLVSGAVLAALGVFVLVEARQWDYLAADGPGPGFFPMWYGAALVALSVVLCAGALTRARRAGTSVGRPGIARAACVWVALALAIALLEVLGFSLSIGLLTVFIACAMYGRPLRFGLTAGVLVPAAFHLVFTLALGVSLPAGFLGF